jgi:hypothetical protein
MKKFFFTALLAVSFLALPVLGAQSLKGMSLNGATGLYSIPTGRIAWERSSDLGLDFGYHTVINDGRAANIPAFAISLFKWVEFSAAFDIQPNNRTYGKDNNDFITGAKIQFPFTNTAIALGGNFQAINLSNENFGYKAGQVYVAFTYAGQFFTMPAETTVVVGKTFRERDAFRGKTNSDIDFGMGFDMVLLPKVFQNWIHWITDFANFSYSDDAFGASAIYRGVLNTGLRIDLAQIPALSKFKFAIDVVAADAFDQGRSLIIGVVFGIPIL